MDRRSFETSRGVRLRLEVPETRRQRMRGLLGRTALEPGCGLLLGGARSVHTVGMRFPILVAFLDRDLTVLGARTVPPGRVVRPRARARHVLELAAGTDLRVGDRILADERSNRDQPPE